MMGRKLTDQERKWRADQARFVKGLVGRWVQDGIVEDTNTALFEKSLAKILATPFDRRYPKLKALEMMAPAEPVDVGAATVISRGHEMQGRATVTSSYQTEIARVEVIGREHEMMMFGVLASYFISYQDIARANYSRVALPSKLGAAAYRAVAEGIDETLSLGNAQAGVTGMINNASVPSAAGAGGVYTGAWATAATTAANIIADVRTAIDAIENGSLYSPTHLAVGPLEWNRLIEPQTKAGYAPNLKTHIQESYGLEVVKWERLRSMTAADAVNGVAGVARAIFYEKSLEVFNPLTMAAPEQYPPVQKDTGYSIAVHQRCGGVESTHPLGALYLDMA